MSPAPTLQGFVWTPTAPDPAHAALPGDMWCVRDAFCALFGWQPGSPNWMAFIQAPLPQDMNRLIMHLELLAFDPEYAPHARTLAGLLDHPAISAYKIHSLRVEHVQYQPHLRFLSPLPAQYVPFRPELFQILVDPSQPPHHSGHDLEFI
jgi:hypothetical protein